MKGDRTVRYTDLDVLKEDARLHPFIKKMLRERVPEVAIRNFVHSYRLLVAGQDGIIPESELEPVDILPDVECLPESSRSIGSAAMRHTVVIKLNGGLGTTMGLQTAKSLLAVKDGRSFIEIIAAACRQRRVPLLLMNSFATQRASLAALGAFPQLRAGLPQDFLQHKVPKVCCRTLGPVEWPVDPSLAWCPPGHGDLFASLHGSSLLKRLRALGYEYAFVSNADNLGAVVDERVLGYVVQHRVPFLMEVTDRTEADRKGGHLARRLDGQLCLRELAQCRSEDRAAFQDIERHRYFNTNNLWLHLPTLEMLMESGDGVLGLPAIANKKTLDPRDPASPPVIQLETAMGAAIGVIPGARALRVSRERFAPVKTTGDLLAVRSDAYILTEDSRVVVNPRRRGAPPVVILDPAYFGRIDQLEERTPSGPPSLVTCTRLLVSGDVRFGSDVTLTGDVSVVNEGGTPLVIEDGSTILGTGTDE